MALKPGGMFFIVAHNRRAFSAGSWEQSRRSLALSTSSSSMSLPTPRLLRNAGFESIKVRSVRNKYPVDYWIKLESIEQHQGQQAMPL